MIQKIMLMGFGGLSAYTAVFSAMSILLYIIAAVCNAMWRANRFNLTDIRKLFVTNLSFSVGCALLEYFLI